MQPQIVWHSIPHLMVGLIVVGLGVLAYTKNRKAPLNRWFALLCFSISCWLIGFGIAINTVTLPDYFFWQKIAHTGVIFTPPIYFSLTVRLLDLPRLRMFPYWYGLLAAIVYGFMWTTDFYFTHEVYRYPWGIYPKASPLLTVYASATLLCAIGCYGLFLHACLRAKRQGLQDQYNRLKYLSAAFAIFACVLIDYLPKYGIDVYPFGYVFTLAFTLVTSYAILKHHILDINIVFQKGLVYSILVAGITVVYLVSVLLTEKLFQGILGYQGIVATLLAAALIAVGFIPFKNAAQQLVDRAFFRGTQLELIRQREQLLHEAQKTDQLKAVATLAAGLAHEIKNPLASIKTFTDYLNTRYADPAFREKFQKNVGGEVERINLIVQQLLEFAKPTPPRLAPMEIPRLVDETLEFLNNELVQRHIEVTRRYETQRLVLGDPKQLRQVFLNLFLNSLDAMNGSGRLEIQTSVQGAELTVTVADNGAGISPKDLPHVFEPFFTTKTTGTGLGLAVVQGIIKEHGGRIDIQSRPGQGTTMTLYLPVVV